MKYSSVKILLWLMVLSLCGGGAWFYEKGRFQPRWAKGVTTSANDKEGAKEALRAPKLENISTGEIPEINDHQPIKPKAKTKRAPVCDYNLVLLSGSAAQPIANLKHKSTNKSLMVRLGEAFGVDSQGKENMFLKSVDFQQNTVTVLIDDKEFVLRKGGRGAGRP